MNLAAMFFLGFFILLTIFLVYYYLVEKPKNAEALRSNVIELQTDGFDFILYKGKVSEFANDYQRFLGNLDIVVYSKSLFVGFLEPRQIYLDLPAKAILSVRYEPNKLTINCYKELIGTKKIVLKGKSTKQLFLLSKKIDFISRRSKKASVI